MRYVVIFLAIFALACPVFGYLSVHGYGVEARVGDSVGSFGVGTYPGGQSLDYNFFHPDYPDGSSHFIVKIDSTTYSHGMVTYSADTVLLPFKSAGYPQILIATNTIQNRWVIPMPSGGTDMIQIDQFLTPDSLGDSLGLIRVRYIINNLTSNTHNIALEHKWDILINSMDGPLIACPGMPYSDTNMVFTPATMPPYFLAASGFLPTSLIGVMLVDSFDATCPDFFASGNEMMLIPSCFDVNPSFAGGPYFLSAALLRWDDVPVPASGFLEIITYYGIWSDFTSIAEVPRPQDFALSAYPNPFNSAVNISVDCRGLINQTPTVEIFDLAGRRVGRIPPAPLNKGGVEQSETGGLFVWQPDESVGSGVYLVHARMGDETTTSKIIYLK